MSSDKRIKTDEWNIWAQVQTISLVFFVNGSGVTAPHVSGQAYVPKLILRRDTCIAFRYYDLAITVTF